MRTSKIDKDRVRELLKTRTAADVAKIMGVSRQRISQMVPTGVLRKSQRMQRLEKAHKIAVLLWNSPTTSSEIAKAAGASIESIRAAGFFLPHRYLRPQTREAIMANIRVSSSGCWEWQRSRNLRGYGMFSHNVYSHRVAHTVFIGDIPDGMSVCHKCDNPPCCNPDHLFLGTPRDNTQDAIAKGRAPQLTSGYPNRGRKKLA